MWDILDGLSAIFLVPLRELLAQSRTHCRNELALKRDEAKSARRQGGGATGGRSKPVMTVEIPNEKSLPEPSLQDEIEVRAGRQGFI